MDYSSMGKRKALESRRMISDLNDNSNIHLCAIISESVKGANQGKVVEKVKAGLGYYFIFITEMLRRLQRPGCSDRTRNIRVCNKHKCSACVFCGVRPRLRPVFVCFRGWFLQMNWFNGSRLFPEGEGLQHKQGLEKLAAAPTHSTHFSETRSVSKT